MVAVLMVAVMVAVKALMVTYAKAVECHVMAGFRTISVTAQYLILRVCSRLATRKDGVV